MYQEVRIYVIETSKEIIRERGEKITAENIKVEFDKLIKGLKIPLKATKDYLFKDYNSSE